MRILLPAKNAVNLRPPKCGDKIEMAYFPGFNVCCCCFLRLCISAFASKWKEEEEAKSKINRLLKPNAEFDILTVQKSSHSVVTLIFFFGKNLSLIIQNTTKS